MPIETLLRYLGQIQLISHPSQLAAQAATLAGTSTSSFTAVAVVDSPRPNSTPKSQAKATSTALTAFVPPSPLKSSPSSRFKDKAPPETDVLAHYVMRLVNDIDSHRKRVRPGLGHCLTGCKEGHISKQPRIHKQGWMRPQETLQSQTDFPCRPSTSCRTQGP